jgi:1-aminocyclopropane-1-carboxylate deaminase/D-cysteine desulfhydrase-like pyridoxal-dependent ACC family enzyme
VLDPAYTAKALACLRHRLAAGESAADAPTVFVHTGSAPGLFAHTAAVAAALGRPDGR